METVPAYEILSQYYDAYWAQFSIEYAEFVSKLLEQSGIQQARILDLGCGTGILAELLGSKGHEVHGVDRSPSMIEVAAENCRELDCVSFSVADMQHFMAPENFTLALCTFDALNYLLDMGQVQSMFRCVSHSLEKDGMFVFDFNTRQKYLDHHGEEIQRKVGGVKFLQRTRFDQQSRVAVTEFQFPNGKEFHYQKAYSVKEVQKALRDADLGVIDVFSDLDGTLYNPGRSHRVFVVAARPLGKTKDDRS